MPSGIWNGTLSFGLVAVPVRMVSATRDQDVRFHQVDVETGERIQIRRVCEVDGDEVAWEDIGRGYDLDGQLITLSDDELAAAAPERTHTIEVEEFVDASSIDSAQYDHPYFLLPGSDSEGTTRAYRLLRDAMARTNQVAIGHVVLRSSEYLVAVRVHDDLLLLTTMLYADEVRDIGEIVAVPGAGDDEPTRGEISQAVELIDAMTREFDAASYEDRHRARLTALIEDRRKDGGRSAGHAEVEQPAPEPVPDLMAALKASLERVRQS